VAVLTGGHPFEHAAFFAMIAALPAIRFREICQPQATDLLAARKLRADVILAYDMPGIVFHGNDPPSLPAPPAALPTAMEWLLEVGQPFVFLHHAIASWPAWEGFADLVGGRFHEAPGTLRGRSWPDSGWRPDVRQTLRVIKPDHPICRGLPESFEIRDETYQCPIFEDEVIPLLLSDAPRGDDFHFSAARAIAGHFADRTGWAHPRGSSYAAWVKRVRNAPIAYIQPGDGPSRFSTGPSVFENEHYRRLLANALHWAASREARHWARGTDPAQQRK
jgi:hypothetical protein